ncbi:MAG: prephenate dehydrogenase/arogenate dehydrogenase family protein [Vicinamibacterales bacterium]
MIGGSIALAIRDVWPDVRIVGVDRSDVLAVARGAHAIDVGSEQLSVLSDVALVVLAAPVKQNLQILPALAGVVSASAIVTDVGSTKRDIVHVAARSETTLTFVGGHPIAGAAVGGFANANADLFRNRPWLFTPTDTTPSSAVERLSRFASALGSTPGVMTLPEHDRVFAYVSHLPQLAISALMAVAGDAVGAEGLGLSGRGLLDSTRLASSPADIWRDVAAVNADEIAPAIDALIAVLASLRADLTRGARMADVFARAARWREELVQRTQL